MRIRRVSGESLVRGRAQGPGGVGRRRPGSCLVGWFLERVVQLPLNPHRAGRSGPTAADRAQPAGRHPQLPPPPHHPTGHRPGPQTAEVTSRRADSPPAEGVDHDEAGTPTRQPDVVRRRRPGIAGCGCGRGRWLLGAPNRGWRAAGRRDEAAKRASHARHGREHSVGGVGEHPLLRRLDRREVLVTDPIRRTVRRDRFLGRDVPDAVPGTMTGRPRVGRPNSGAPRRGDCE